MALSPIQIPIGSSGLFQTVYKLDAFSLGEVMDGLTTSQAQMLHPAFIVNGSTKDAIYVSRYEATTSSSVATVSYGAGASTGVAIADAKTYCSAMGSGWHMMTNAEWAAVALWCKKNSSQPRGNNDYGKDYHETSGAGIPFNHNAAGRVAKIRNGTGGNTYSHNGQADGIFDLNGNVWEWMADVRLKIGQIQVIPYNNAADTSVDTSDTSTQWVALNSNATGYSDLFVANPTPTSVANRTGTVSVRFVASGSAVTTYNPCYTLSGTGTLMADEGGTYTPNFGLMIPYPGDANPLSDFCKLYLRSLCLLSLDDAQKNSPADYNGSIYGVNGNKLVDEYYLARGGSYSSRSGSGVFAMYLRDTYGTADQAVGYRPCYVG